jgi:Zn-dependent M28 family amino/carboxypeptidase
MVAPLPSASTVPPTPSSVPLVYARRLAGQVDAERLMADVRWLAADARQGRLTGSPAEDEVGAWLAYRFKELGLVPFSAAGFDDFVQPFPLPEFLASEPGVQGENVIAILPGTGRPDSYVYIGAHYDHLGLAPDGQVYNGADDDASGVAAVLEVARILRASEQRPQESVVFVAFSGEEVGRLGSEALCQQLWATDLAGYSQLLNMEVLGAVQGQGTYLDVWDQDDLSTESLVGAVLAAGQELGVEVVRRGRDPGSDAVEWIECGLPAISLDVAWSYETHPHYHRPSDDPEHIDIGGLRDATRVAVMALWRLANDGR